MKLQPGVRIGPYEILSLLGSGGMGDVYRSRDTTLGREVALKILPTEFTADAMRLARFQQEARLASSLNHPDIVTIYGVGTHEGISYIAMELVTGKTVAELIRQGPLPLDQVVAIALQVADGMAKAHSVGIVHRDLKPQNLMLNDDGIVKILDFGLSKAMPVGNSLSSMPTVFDSTASGVIMGTAKYMSPEQASGKSTDFRSDQFSFGAVLYEMLSGRPPFERDTVVQILSSIIEDEAEPVSGMNPRVPETLESVLQRCMTKDPNGRYASTQSLYMELLEVQKTLGAARPRLRPRLTRVWTRHWRAIAILSVLALAVAGVLYFGARHPDRFQVVSIPAQKQLAILPFTSLDGGQANQALLDGLVETLSSRLGQLERYQTGLLVIPASEIQRQRVTTPQAARQALGATLIMNGAVQRTAESLRLTLTLIDPKEMRQLRSAAVDVRLNDARGLQEGLLVRAAEMLEIDVKPEARTLLSAGDTVASLAYEPYLQGRGYLRRYDKVESMDNAIAAFQQALNRDPDYALALAGLCEAFWRKYDLTKDASLIEQARPNCARAVLLGADIPAVHVTNAMLHTATGEYEDAVQETRRAIDIDPTNADAYRELARAYQQMGKSGEAEAIYKKVIEVRPNDFLTHINLGNFYFRLGRYSEAAGEFRELVRLTPDNPRTYSNLGAVYIMLKRDDEAIEMLQRSLDLEPSASAYSNLGVIHYRHGKYADAAKNFERSLKLNPDDRAKWRNLATTYKWIDGQEQKSQEAYRHAVELGEKQLKVNPKDPSLLTDLADSYASLGERAKALDTIRQALALKNDDPIILKSAGVVFEELGDRTRALDLIAQAFRNGLPRDGLDDIPSIANLRADPRFQALRER